MGVRKNFPTYEVAGWSWLVVSTPCILGFEYDAKGYGSCVEFRDASTRRRCNAGDECGDGGETWDGKPIAAEPPYGAMVLVYRVELGSGPFCFLFVLL